MARATHTQQEQVQVNEGSFVPSPECLHREIEQLRQALATRAVIEQAKGVLMLRYGLDADRAFAVLVRWSQDTNVKLNVLARSVTTSVAAGQLPDLSQQATALLADRQVAR